MGDGNRRASRLRRSKCQVELPLTGFLLSIHISKNPDGVRTGGEIRIFNKLDSIPENCPAGHPEMCALLEAWRANRIRGAFNLR
jgi:hypothetical protein